MKRFKNIILDLGGVIINLNTSATIKAFQALGTTNFEDIYTQLAQHGLFDAFDKGTISELQFHKELVNLIQLPVSFSQFETAWNAMLLDFPKHRLDKISTLKPNYRTFLLSNTNETHVRQFEAILREAHHVPNLEGFFEKAYYSCNMGMRKPDTEIFEYLIKTHGLLTDETLFIDDSPQHIEGAKRCGIQAYLLLPGKELHELLEELEVV
jgi:glucose-1-phosphatase